MQKFLFLIAVLAGTFYNVPLFASNTPVISLQPSFINVAEGDAGSSTIELNITLSEAPDTGSIAVEYTTSAGVAENQRGDNDFISAEGNVTFSIGDDTTKTLYVTINGDTTSEGNENFSVEISATSELGQNYSLDISESNITIINDDTIADANGSGIPMLPDSNAPCDIFSNVLATYDYLDVSASANIQACYTDAIAYPVGNISGTVMCDESACSGGVYSCTRDDPPLEKYYTTFPTNSLSGSVESPVPTSLSKLEYGDMTYTSGSTLTLTPSYTYDNFNRPVMLLGDVVFTKNGNTLNFYPGDYYIDSLTFQKSTNTINLPSGGVVRLFIQGDFSVDLNNLLFNTSGSASNIFVFVAGDFVSIGNGGGTTSFKAYMYVKGNVELDNNSNNWKMYGGLTAEGNITITGNNPDFIQDGDPGNFGMGTCTQSSYLYGPFDAWDTFRSISNPQISTKVAGSAFNLTLASLDENRSGFETKEGVDVTYWLYDKVTDKVIPSTQGTYSADNNSTAKTFSVNSAYKQATLQFRLCCLYNGSVFTPFNDSLCSTECTTATNIIPCYRTINSSDSFAIRPKSFSLAVSPNGPIKAGNEFNITFSALNIDGSTATHEYNETLNNTFSVDYNESNPGCALGTLAIPSFAFNNGSANVVGITYNETGAVSITVSEKSNCSDRYSAIDCSDTLVFGNFNPSTDTVIAPALVESHPFIPDRFEITPQLNAKGNGFTYLSSDLNHSSTLSIAIKAVNLDGNTTKNYTSSCYANLSDLSIEYTPVTLTPDSSLSQNLYKETNTSLDGNSNFNQPMEITSIPVAVFDDALMGEANLELLINFNRSKSTPVNPFELNITSITLTDTNNTAGTDTPSTSVKYLYGRTHIPRHVTEGSTAETAVYYEFYCDADCDIASHSSVAPNAKQSNDSIWWFVNEHHDTGNDGNITATQTRNAYLNGDFITMAPNAASSQLSYIYNASKGYPYKVSAELTTQEWLLSHQFDAGTTRNYFELEFYNTAPQKSGVDNDIGTVELNASKKRNWRLMW